MKKYIYIINGSGGVGKDQFVEYVTIIVNDIFKKFHSVINFSSIDKVKEIAREIGWQGQKDEKDRKFLSDLKKLTSEYNDMPFKSMKQKVQEFKKDETAHVLFLHIREPEQIKRAVEEFNANTILVTRDSINHIISNDSDRNIFNYKYDYIIENNGTLEELCDKAREFVGRIDL